MEPHLAVAPTQRRMESLWKARWGEHVVESHLKNLGPLGNAGDRLADTPLQLYLLYSRLVRARLEIDIYSEVLGR